MDFTKDYKGMTREERLADPDWLEMTVLERLAAIGILRDIDGHEVTLQEQYNQRFQTPEQIQESLEKAKSARDARIAKHREQRAKAEEFFKNKRGEIEKKVAEEFEELTK
jgi:hypothetical protein